MREWLGAIRLPAAFEEAFADELRRRRGGAKVKNVAREMSGIDRRLERLRDLYELGDLSKTEYRGRRDKLEAERAELERARTGPLRAPAETIDSLVDDWEQMDAGQKRRVLETIFTEVTIDDGQLVAATPRPGWLPYLETILGDRSASAPARGSLVGRRRRGSNP